MRCPRKDNNQCLHQFGHEFSSSPRSKENKTYYASNIKLRCFIALGLPDFRGFFGKISLAWMQARLFGCSPSYVDENENENETKFTNFPDKHLWRQAKLKFNSPLTRFYNLYSFSSQNNPE